MPDLGPWISFGEALIRSIDMAAVAYQTRPDVPLGRDDRYEEEPEDDDYADA